MGQILDQRSNEGRLSTCGPQYPLYERQSQVLEALGAKAIRARGMVGKVGCGQAGWGRPGLTPGIQRDRVSSVGSAGGQAWLEGMGIWLQRGTLLCFLFNYNEPGSYKGSFCWGSLGEGGRQG